jgi:type IV pilus assembly protein PilV
MTQHISLPASPANLNKQQGVALLEALVAILIFSVGILSLVGMQATARRYATDAEFRSTASYLANQRIADAWVADRTTLITNFTKTDTLSELPSGKRIVTVTADPTSTINGYIVSVTINWQIPGDTVTHALVATTQIHDRCDTLDCAAS